MKPVKILITGASGLLGTAVTRRLAAAAEVVPLAHSVIFPGMVQADLHDVGKLDALSNLEWDAVVHCAAYRHPEFCEAHRDKAEWLNAEVPGRIAAMAAVRGARMIHISSDYVFDGTHPPYTEEVEPNPVNFYGVTKLHAEQKIKDAYRNAVILRVPALYGNAPPPVESTFIEEAIQAAVSDEHLQHDDTIVRYPTFTGDVAEIIRFLLETDVTGILHASAPEKATRYEWARYARGLLGKNPSVVTRLDHDPSRKATRPLDAHLDTTRLKELGGPMPRGYSEIVPSLDRIREVKADL